MSWDDPDPGWKCACGINHGGLKKKCGGCGWTYEKAEQYKKAADIEKANVCITDDDKLVADSERILAKCLELNEKFKSIHKVTSIHIGKNAVHRKKVNDTVMQEFKEINYKSIVNIEENNSQAIVQGLKEKICLMSSAARFVLMGIIINHGFRDNN